MTDQEKEIKRVISYIRSCRDAGIDTTITIDKNRNHFILNALEEIQQYRAIGTAEECREAREKQRAKKPIMKPFYEDMEEEYLCCPNCGHILTDRIPADNKDFYFHCLNCGQKFDWSDNE